MIQLVKEITKGLLEQAKKTVAVYGGGFKPPTKGHFEVVKQALDENPEIDEFLIYVGKAERDGVTQEDSMKIWGIYRNYLPYKVKIRQSTQPPIKEVYDYAKEHPDEEVLWVIGAREENEADFADIASRTKSITKYPNLELRTIVTKGGVSGTAARNAAKVSPEKLNQFIPDFLSSQEKNNIFVILNNEISEGRKKKKLKENFIPGKVIIYPDFQGVDIDTNIKGRRRVLNVDNCIGNEPNKDYNYFTTEKKKYVEDMVKNASGDGWKSFDPIVAIPHPLLNGKYLVIDGNHRLGAFVIGKLPKIKALVPSEDQILLAVPGSKWDKNKLPETISLKDAKKQGVNLKEYFTTKSLKVPTSLNEHASYTDSINIPEKIAELTQHMIDKGMNIEPLPTMEFIDGDSENAKDFFGKTAYYDPDRKHIVLYTEGRHPKDIVRSYAHEMIHHIQNLEGRLGNITTTNTTEDDHLTKLEQEANLKGTMTFRGWTDSIKEKKTKDPFGLNAFAHELARLREDEQNYKIYLDMDGVVADFDKRFTDLAGMGPREFEDKYGKNAFWDFIDEGDNKVKFWVGIPPMEGASQLVDYVSKHDYVMLTAPSVKKQSRLGKNLWIRNYTGKIFPSKPKVIFKAAKEKHKVKPSLTEKDILIDDKASTIDNWNATGGTGILYQSAPQVISKLKELGL